MKRFAILAAITAVLFWSAGTASAQYRASPPRYHTTMSGYNSTMSGHLQTNHNHITPRPVSVSGYSTGAFPSLSVYPGGNYYNPAVWSGPAYSSGGYGYGGYGYGYGSMYGGYGWRR